MRATPRLYGDAAGRPRFSGRGRWLASSWSAILLASLCLADEPPPPRPLLPASLLNQFATQYLASLGRQDGEVISRADIQGMLAEVQRAGWGVPYQETLLKELAEDGDFVVVFSRDKAGRRWLLAARGQANLYDRVDRISGVSGGQKMLHDVARLPDGARYARPTPGNFIPDLLDLLPKQGGGKRRSVPDYHKPTGKVYTQADVLRRLAELHQEAERGGRP